MKTLIFITSRFPYELGEAFIDSEFPFLCSAFDRIILITKKISGGKLKPVPPDVSVYRYDPSSSWKEYSLVPFLVLRNFNLIVALVKQELIFRRKVQKEISAVQKLFLLKSIIKSLQLRDFIKNVISTEKPEGELFFYSYWMNVSANAICMLTGLKAIRISRAHRVDLYEEETDQKYLPLVSNTFLNLNAIFFISEHGKRYFEERYGLIDKKNIVSRLGVINAFPFSEALPEHDIYRIVSCSTLIRVKRVHLLIKALAKVKSTRKISWYHFGEGPLKLELMDLAESTLGNLDRIEYKFMGRVMNAEIMKFYSRNEVDLLCNTSSSEGIPVSIMEAQSFGIPAIATDTGGTSEIIGKETGILLPVDFEVDDLAQRIEYLLNLEPGEKIRMKKAIYDNWKRSFNAYINFEDFISSVVSLTDPDLT